MYDNLTDLFKGICDSIREKNGESDLIKHQDIPDKIGAIQGGGGAKTELLFFNSIMEIEKPEQDSYCEIEHVDTAINSTI